jgi:hypothetical protein
MIDKQIINFLKNTNPASVSKPQDMGHFSKTFFNIGEEHRDKYVTYWCKGEEKFSKNIYKEFQYYINDMGFRGHYPQPYEKDFLAFFGCSMTFGQGLPEEEIFPCLVSKHFNKQYLNFGIPGASCKQVSLIFSAATHLWNIETAIVNLPTPYRFLYASDKTLGSVLLNKLEDLIDPSKPQPYGAIIQFHDEFFYLEVVQSVQWMIDIAKSKNINLKFCTWSKEIKELFKEIYDLDVPFMEGFDTCRDNHPGPESHKRFAEDIIKTINIL